MDIDHATVNTRLRRRADISDGARKQLRKQNFYVTCMVHELHNISIELSYLGHSVLNHQHMSENWHIVTASSDDDEHGEDEVQQQANDIERTLRFSESNTGICSTGPLVYIPPSISLSSSILHCMHLQLQQPVRHAQQPVAVTAAAAAAAKMTASRAAAAMGTRTMTRK